MGHSKSNTKKPTLVIGKIHAKWCGHCTALVPEWNKMRSEIIKRFKDKYRLIFEEVEQTQEKDKLHKINKKHLANSNNKVEVQGGYPTLFKIHNGKLEYHNGERHSKPMTKWFTGDDNENNVKDFNDFNDFKDVKPVAGFNTRLYNTFKPTKNSIRTADLNSSWSVTDKEMNPSTESADSNLQRFNLGGGKRKTRKARKTRRARKTKGTRKRNISTKN